MLISLASLYAKLTEQILEEFCFKLLPQKTGDHRTHHKDGIVAVS